MKNNHWPVIWGMLIALLAPIVASYFGWVALYFGNLFVAVFALFLWGLYFYAIYLLCSRPHDQRFVEIYMAVVNILLLPWSIVLVFTYSASASRASAERIAAGEEQAKDG